MSKSQINLFINIVTTTVIAALASNISIITTLTLHAPGQFNKWDYRII